MIKISSTEESCQKEEKVFLENDKYKISKKKNDQTVLFKASPIDFSTSTAVIHSTTTIDSTKTPQIIIALTTNPDLPETTDKPNEITIKPQITEAYIKVFFFKFIDDINDYIFLSYVILLKIIIIFQNKYLHYSSSLLYTYIYKFSKKKNSISNN